MSIENLEQKPQPDLTFDNKMVNFLAVRGSISGLVLKRSIGESFIIGNYDTGHFIKFQLLFWNRGGRSEG